MTMTPTEYFARNFWIGASFLRPSEAPLCRDLGIDHVMWGADYPHSEGSYPYTTEALRVAFADYAEPEVRAMVETTAAVVLRVRPRPRCARSATGSVPRWPTWPQPLAPGELADRRRPATRSTPRRSCVPGEQRGGHHETVRYGARPRK